MVSDSTTDLAVKFSHLNAYSDTQKSGIGLPEIFSMDDRRKKNRISIATFALIFNRSVAGLRRGSDDPKTRPVNESPLRAPLKYAGDAALLFKISGSIVFTNFRLELIKVNQKHAPKF